MVPLADRRWLPLRCSRGRHSRDVASVLHCRCAPARPTRRWPPGPAWPSVAPHKWRYGAVRGPSGPARSPGTAGRGERSRRRSCRGGPARRPRVHAPARRRSRRAPRRRGVVPGPRPPCAARNPLRTPPPAQAAAPSAVRGHGHPPTPSTCTVTAPSSRPRIRSTVDPTADRTWAVSDASSWPGRATTHIRITTRSSTSLTVTPGPTRARRHHGPARPTRATPGTSKAASRTRSAITWRATDRRGSLTTEVPRRLRIDRRPRCRPWPRRSTRARRSWPSRRPPRRRRSPSGGGPDRG